VIERHWTDFGQGTVKITGNPLDVAISGKGFLSVNGPSGTLYTRNGNLRLSATGSLVTSDGYPVRLAGGRTLQLEPGAAVEIATDGTVTQNGQPLGTLEVVDFREPNILVKQGQKNYFKVTDPNQAPAAATSFELLQGKLESSNVGTAESAVRLVSVMRQFEMLQKAITIGGEMNRRAVEEVAKVGS
jgi:flagellar basal-body rod protein FlgF